MQYKVGLIINLMSFVIIERTAVSSIAVGSRRVGQLFINLLSFSKKRVNPILKRDFVFEKVSRRRMFDVLPITEAEGAERRERDDFQGGFVNH